MTTVENSQHGTPGGYMYGNCHQECCRTAYAAYRRHEIDIGDHWPPLTPRRSPCKKATDRWPGKP